MGLTIPCPFQDAFAIIIEIIKICIYAQNFENG